MRSLEKGYEERMNARIRKQIVVGYRQMLKI
jgi:hypothetical protein